MSPNRRRLIVPERRDRRGGMWENWSKPPVGDLLQQLHLPVWNLQQRHPGVGTAYQKEHTWRIPGHASTNLET